MTDQKPRERKVTPFSQLHALDARIRDALNLAVEVQASLRRHGPIMSNAADLCGAAVDDLEDALAACRETRDAEHKARTLD